MTDETKSVDVRMLDKKELPQISSIKIDETKSPDERAVSFLKQLGGKYAYMDGDMVVGFSYSDTDIKLSNKLAMYASALN